MTVSGRLGERHVARLFNFKGIGRVWLRSNLSNELSNELT